jgi:tRNA threonylcarbamoyladenosine biosynthesis protein TsaB
MNILAMDCAGPALQVAFSAGGNIYAMECEPREAASPSVPARHSELLLSFADALLKTAGFTPADIGMVACMQGPGSFTGLRIAYSAAKGMALALNVPMAVVPTLDCIAWPCRTFPGLVIPAIDAKKSRFFSAVYRDGKPLGPPLDATPQSVAELIRSAAPADTPVLLSGPGAASLCPILSGLLREDGRQVSVFPEAGRGRAREIITILGERNEETPDEGKTREILSSGPLYLRASDAELTRMEAVNGR